MKQRLVGTLVLGSLALILIPLLLDGEGVERPPLSGNIPPAPILDTTPLPAATRPVIEADAFEAAVPEPIIAEETVEADTTEAVADASPALVTTEAEATAQAASEPETIPASNDAPALDAAGLPEAWVVRVGVFGDKANAERLTARLEADNYKAFMRPVGVSNGVYIGPVATRSEAAAIQQRLNAARAGYQIGEPSVQRYDMGQR